MFEKSLQDLVKGIRSSKNDTSTYISKAIQEIKEELKSRDMTIKAQALQKLTYLNMLGHDMSWAAFHIIEVMSQERFALKRVGFLAASQSFTPTTEVLVLCTQLLKKEFQAKSPFEIGLAINALSNIVTEDLARDLLSDVVTMLTSSRPYIRKKATLVLYKLYLQYPQGLRLTFDNLQRRLTDEVPGVVSCAVNVICELARKKPGNYLRIAPDLFNLLTTSSNNWMVIKVAKLMSALVQEEPRLARKLLEPLANVVQSTPAKSLMYECISTITFALQHTKKPDGTDAKNAPAVVRLCTDRLREMIRDPDQNLKYLGLVGLVSLMRSNPRVVAEHRELVLTCLLDEDVTIRLRALELITGMVTRRNLPDIVKRLMELLEQAEGHFRDELIEKTVFMCSRDKYAYLADFAWYIGILAKLAYLQNTRHSLTVASQLLDVAVRVEEVRPVAMQHLLPMIADQNLAASARQPDLAAVTVAASAAVSVEGSALSSVDANLGTGHVLYAAAWIVGEYCAVIPGNLISTVIDALLQAGTLTLPAAVQTVYVQAALKLLAAAANTSLRAGDSAGFLKLASSVLERLHPFAQSIHVEVQERACLVQQLMSTLGVPFTPLPTPAALAEQQAKEAEDLMNLVGAGTGQVAVTTASSNKIQPMEPDLKFIANLLNTLFAEPLKPVNQKAQKKVAAPEGLDLDKWINREQKDDKDEPAGTFRYTSISFEDEYGLKDDEYAGGMAQRPIEGGIGKGHDSDDDKWLASLQRDNERRNEKLFGVPSKKGKEKEGDKKHHRAGEKATPSRNDPYILKSTPRSRAETEHSRDERESVKEEAPKPNALADPSIFGDFGVKKKAGKSKKGKKAGKKAAGGDSEEEDERAGPTKKSYAIMEDEDMPEGGGATDDDADRGNDVADALSKVDLSTPLRDDETLPTRTHRTVNQPGMAAAGKGRGRARVLPGAEPTEAEKKASRKGKKERKEKKEAKAGEEKKPPKEKESKKERAAAPVAGSGPSPPKPAAPLKQGDEYAPAEPYAYALGSDKYVRVTYTISAVPASGGNPGVAAVHFRVEPRSSKKTIDWVDVEFANDGDVIRTGLKAGASAKAVRLGTGLKEKAKGKNRAMKATVPLAVADPSVTTSQQAKFTYQVKGSSSPASLTGNLVIRSAALLVPTLIDPADYRNLMVNEGASFTHTIVNVPIGSRGPEATMQLVFGIFRAHAVQQAAAHAILYARTLNGAHVTALLKVEKSAMTITAKSVIAGHAVSLANDITEVTAVATTPEDADD